MLRQPKTIQAVSLCAALIGLTLTLAVRWTPTLAHSQGRSYPIYPLPDDTAIDVKDGSVADWKDLGIPPSLTQDDFRREFHWWNEKPLHARERVDFEYRVWLGWRENCICIAVERVDDVYINRLGGQEYVEGQCDSCLYRQDHMEFMVDGDHGGGWYVERAGKPESANQYMVPAQIYLGVAESPDGRTVTDPWISINQWPGWTVYVKAGGSSTGTVPDTSVIELCVTPFDSLAHADPPTSVVSSLRPGAIVGFDMQILDYDSLDFHTTRGQTPKWIDSVSGYGTTLNADLFVDGLLLPEGSTGVQETTTWGQVKKIQRPQLTPPGGVP